MIRINSVANPDADPDPDHKMFTLIIVLLKTFCWVDNLFLEKIGND